MKISYDPKCEELARWFLEEYGETNPEFNDVQALASAIQRAIENYMEDRPPAGREGEPDDVSGQGEE
jgi:hypothetical protein